MPPTMTSDCNRDAKAAFGAATLLDTVFCGDNTKILSGFPAECVDLVVTSPPYDDLRTYGGCSWNFEALAAQLVRVLKPGGVIVWVVADATVNGSETGTSMRQALGFMAQGLNLHDTMIYYRNSPHPPNVRYWQEFEFMFVLSKGQPHAFNPVMQPKAASSLVRAKGNFNAHIRQKDGSLAATVGKAKERIRKSADKLDRIKSNVWRYSVGGGLMAEERYAAEHPAPFPESLAKDHISSWSNPGELVLDPFAGSGTTLKAAKQLNRRYVGIEIHEPYINIIKNRLAQDALSLGV